MLACSLATALLLLLLLLVVLLQRRLLLLLLLTYAAEQPPAVQLCLLSIPHATPRPASSAQLTDLLSRMVLAPLLGAAAKGSAVVTAPA
jgi:hypothetical protein